MATCISCDKRYYLDNPGCTLRFCTQECLRSYTCDHIRPGWAGDINEVFEERDRLREEVKELRAAEIKPKPTERQRRIDRQGAGVCAHGCRCDMCGPGPHPEDAMGGDQ
jgi:hypothetical protein